VTRKTAAFFVPTVLALLALVLVPATFAAKGGNAGASGKPGGGDSVTLRMVTDQNGNTAPNWGDEITFDVSTTADKPYVNVRCYQGTAFVYDAWVGYYAGAWFGQTFTLSSSYWLGGAADCTARLVTWSKNGREQTLNTLTVPVAA